MSTVRAILGGARESHKLPLLRIVETGNRDTIEIAKWCSENQDSSFESSDLDSVFQEAVHRTLEQTKIAQFCVFRTQDHKKFLTDLSWVDVAFLSADSLQNGLEEFHLAASAGARVVVMRNFQSSAVLAVRQAQRFGWHFESSGDYSIMIRQ